jgi:hypothetical protein
MKIAVEVTLSEAYYQVYYGEWLASRSKYRKWQPLVGGLLLSWGGLLYLLSGNNAGRFWLFPLLFVVAGLYELGTFYRTKQQWLRGRLDSRLLNQCISLSFEHHCIRHKEPFSTGELSWAGLRQLKETPKGLFLIPENGISIYMPKQAFQSPVQIQEVSNRAKQMPKNLPDNSAEQ